MSTNLNYFIQDPFEYVFYPLIFLSSTVPKHSILGPLMLTHSSLMTSRYCLVFLLLCYILRHFSRYISVSLSFICNLSFVCSILIFQLRNFSFHMSTISGRVSVSSLSPFYRFTVILSFGNTKFSFNYSFIISLCYYLFTLYVWNVSWFSFQFFVLLAFSLNAW